MKRWRKTYTEHPERIAGPRAVEIFGDHLVENPKKLEELAERAGYKISPRD